jgi:transposase
LYYLPTYSPELNLIEIVWRKIKGGGFNQFNKVKSNTDL